MISVCVVALLAGGGGAYLVWGQASSSTGAPPVERTSVSPSKATKAAAVTGPDLCAILPKEEADRLVPGAKVGKEARDTELSAVFSCEWSNQRISFGEHWRSRRITVRLDQFRGDGAKTGRSMAQTSYEAEYSGARYVETAKPTVKKGEKDYTSPISDIPGVGDGAFAQYTWRRSGTMLWYSFGTAHARVQDMIIKVTYQASQQRKDAEILSNKTVQSVTEANAIREVTGVVKHIVKGVAAWKAEHPDVVGKPYAAATASPTVAPTPAPTPLAAFPPACQAVTAAATGLVPGPTTRARRVEVGNDTRTDCRWLNLDVPAGDKVTRIRSVLITVHSFTDRAGETDAPAARSFFASERGSDKNVEESKFGDISMGKVADLPGLGEQAYSQYVQTRGAVSAGSGMVLVRQGAVVVQVDYAGADRPKGEATGSPKTRLLPDQEARAGALVMTKAFLAALADKPIGG